MGSLTGLRTLAVLAMAEMLTIVTTASRVRVVGLSPE